ncbi:MAG: hypothetical protein LBR33_11105 [Propionibacteriaceae bacterium]|nr:hypothetical protein [Propionibacteriaceae bacterium]
MPAPVAAPPVTGQGVIDQALAGLAALDEADVAEHPARLARAHEILRATLHGAPIDDLRDEGA